MGGGGEMIVILSDVTSHQIINNRSVDKRTATEVRLYKKLVCFKNSSKTYYVVL